MKDTLRTIELLEEHIDRLAESGIYEIERDLLLERLRGAYATALSIEAIAEEEIVIETLVGLQNEDAEPAEEPVAEEEVVPAEEPAEEQIVLEDEPVRESVEEPEVEDYPVDEPMDECMNGCPPEEYQEIPEEPEAEDVPARDSQESLFALYDDEEEEPVEDEPAVVVEVPTEEPAEEPEPEEQPLYEESAPEVEEESAEEPFVDEYEPEERSTISLRNTIGVNDKIILMRDLFNGNSEYYDRVITTLDSFDSLDEAMIHIHDNYHWNPQTEGARLLVELLAHKLF